MTYKHGTRKPSGEPPIAPLLLKVPEACHAMRISRAQLYRMIDSGELRTILVGPRQRRVPVSEINAYLARKMAEPEPGQKEAS